MRFFFRLIPDSLQSLQAKLSFSSKEIVALSCAWCKSAYHNKESCFIQERIGEECALGKLGESKFSDEFTHTMCSTTSYDS